MHIETMSDKDILDFVKKRGGSPTAIGAIRSKTIEDFFAQHSITVQCPKCGSLKKTRNGYNGKGTTRFRCADCGRNYSLLSNTIFDGSAFTLDEMISAVHCVITQQPLEYIENNLGTSSFSHGTVWYLVHRIMYILNQMSRMVLTGVIQMDEKYFREDQKGSKALVSFIAPTERRKPRHHLYRSECGIFGPEFVNVLCAVDGNRHYWAKCICLGPMDEKELDKITDFRNISYICSDNYDAYGIWCDKHGYRHYVEPSNYRKERQARGYIDTDDIYHSLTKEEYAKDEAINRQMYKEGRYPHIENADHDLTFDEFIAIRSKFGLGINRVNSFHAQLETWLVKITHGVASDYLQDYIGAFVYIMNYKTDHHIRTFSLRDAEDILADMVKHTIAVGHSPTIKDIDERNIEDLPRPSRRATNLARTRIKKARAVVIEPQEHGNKNEYEGHGLEIAFNKEKFFREIGTTRLNELAKLYGVYDRKEHKKDRIRRMCELPNVQDIIFNEIVIANYKTPEEMAETFAKLPEKKKRGRPKKTP